MIGGVKLGPHASFVLLATLAVIVSGCAGATPDPEVAKRCATYEPELDARYAAALASCAVDERGYDACETATRDEYVPKYEKAACLCAGGTVAECVEGSK